MKVMFKFVQLFTRFFKAYITRNPAIAGGNCLLFFDIFARKRDELGNFKNLGFIQNRCCSIKTLMKIFVILEFSQT